MVFTVKNTMAFLVKAEKSERFPAEETDIIKAQTNETEKQNEFRR
ncbi:hypothetical protein [Ruminococcus sp. 5_1_39BFAA]